MMSGRKVHSLIDIRVPGHWTPHVATTLRYLVVKKVRSRRSTINEDVAVGQSYSTYCRSC